METNSRIEMELMLSFNCHRCRGPVWIKRGDIREFSGDRAFCGNCGAAYVYYERKSVITIERIRYGQMYMPPLEWNEIHLWGLKAGERNEGRRRRRRTFWQRLGDFIRNR